MEQVVNAEIIQYVVHAFKMAVLSRNSQNSFVLCNFDKITLSE